MNRHSYHYYHERFTSLAECNLAEDKLVTAGDTAKNRNIFAYLAYQRLKQQHNNPHLSAGDVVSTVTSHKRLLQSADMSQMAVDYGLESALVSVTAALYSAAKTPGYRAQVSLKAEGRMLKQVTWPIVSADYTHVVVTGKDFNRLGQRVTQHNAENQGIVCVAYAMAKGQRCFYYFNQDQLDEVQSEGWHYRQQVQEFLAAQQSVSQQQGQTATAVAYAKEKFNEFLGQEEINIVDFDDHNQEQQITLCEVLLISKDPLLKKDPVRFVSTALLNRLAAPKLSLGQVSELGVNVSITLGLTVKERMSLGTVRGYNELTNKLIDGYQRLKHRLDRINITKDIKISDKGPTWGGRLRNTQGKKAARGSLLSRAEALTSDDDNEGNLLNLATDDISGSFNVWGIKDKAQGDFRWYDIQGDAAAQFMRYTADAATRMHLDHNALLINSHAKAEVDAFTGNCQVSSYFPNKQGWHAAFELVAKEERFQRPLAQSYHPLDVINCGRFFVKLESELSAVVAATGSLYANAVVHFKRFRTKDGRSRMLAQMVPLTDKEHAEYQSSKKKVVPEKALKRIKTIKPSIKTDIGVKAFAGAELGATIQGAIYWQDPGLVPEKPKSRFNPDSSYAYYREQQLKQQTPYFRKMMSVTLGVDGALGAGLEYAFRVHYSAQLQRFILVFKAEAVCGIGFGGHFECIVEGKEIEQFALFLYHQLSQIDFSHVDFQKTIDKLFYSGYEQRQRVDGFATYLGFGICYLSSIAGEITLDTMTAVDKISDWVTQHLEVNGNRLNLAKKILVNSEAKNEGLSRINIVTPESKGLLLYKLCEYYTIFKSPDSEPMKAIFQLLHSCQSLQELDLLFKYCVNTESDKRIGIKRPQPNKDAKKGLEILFSAFANRNIHAGEGKNFTELLLSHINNQRSIHDFYQSIESLNKIIVEVLNKKQAIINIENNQLISNAAYLGLATIFSPSKVTFMSKMPKENAIGICRIPDKNDSDFELFNAKVETLGLLVKQVSQLRPIKLPQDAIDIEQAILKRGVYQSVSSFAVVANPTFYQDSVATVKFIDNVGLLKSELEKYLRKVVQ
ncbi:hypothetical protein [Piscirickettsia salmonis]|uniref:hypothetical protein n=1 Tax=Piscirickettsia salmonis TaxID=1238 RepID=UPI0012FEE01B